MVPLPPCQTRLWRWPLTLQTTWWASPVLWWRQSLLGTHWRLPSLGGFSRSLEGRKTAPHETVSSQTLGTCQDTRRDTEERKMEIDGLFLGAMFAFFCSVCEVSMRVFLSPERALEVLSWPRSGLRCLPSSLEAPLQPSLSKLMGCSDSKPTEGGGAAQ